MDADADVYARRLIAARCPELGGDGTGANLRFEGADGGTQSAQPVVMIPPEMARHILDALEAINERLDVVERLVRGRA
jgi:hypothetical protein